MLEPKATASHLDSTLLRHAERFANCPLKGLDHKSQAHVRTNDPEQKSEIKIVRISDTGTSLESGVRRLEPLRARHYAVQAIGGHIRELGRYSIRVLVKGFGLADTARISADPSITLLSQLSK
jgi:hypothetical protein